jgi:hypothetical protein
LLACTAVEQRAWATLGDVEVRMLEMKWGVTAVRLLIKIQAGKNGSLNYLAFSSRLCQETARKPTARRLSLVKS